MSLIREAIPIITTYVIFLGVFALFESIHAYLRDSGEGEKNKHVLRATIPRKSKAVLEMVELD